MWKGPFPGVLGVGGLLSRPDMLWILSPLSLQMCVPDIFSKLNLTLLFPVQSRHRPPPTTPGLGEALDLAHNQKFFLSRQQCLGGHWESLCLMQAPHGLACMGRGKVWQ